MLETRHLRDTGDGHFDARAAGDPSMRESRVRSQEVPPKCVQLVGSIDASAGVLYLAPLGAVHVMRPDMSHLDATLKAGISEAAAGAAARSATAGQPMKLQTQFRRRDPATEKAAEAYRRTTWIFHSAQDEADPWVELSVHGPSSEEARAVRDACSSYL